MDWGAFKETRVAVRCTSDKERFFADCALNGIHNFMSDGAIKRDLFVCRLHYKDFNSDGRYELMSLEEWQIKENGLFGKYGLGVVDYEID